MGHELSKVKRDSIHTLSNIERRLPKRFSSIHLPKSIFPSRRLKTKKILILSLDAAGKTTLLFYLKKGEIVNTIPTIGYNHEEIEYKKCNYSFWDIGGQDGVRQFWIHYFFKVNGIIFIVDSNDRERLEEAHQVLESVINNLRVDDNTHHKCPILVLANKQDLCNVLTKEDIYVGLRLNHYTDIQTSIISTSIIKGVGIDEIWEWLHNEVSSS